MTSKMFIKKYKAHTRNGFTNANLPWFSPTDISREFGKTRQWWCKMIKSGKMGSHKTSAGPIVTTEQLISYFETT